MTLKSGIYQIENQVNGKRYIGSAVNLKKRWREHLAALRRGKHRNRHLQRAFDKYGREAFVFSVLEHVDSERLIEREQQYLDTVHADYNISPTAGSSLGVQHTEETRRKMSEAKHGERHSWYGKRHSEESRKKMSEAWTAERRQARSEGQVGKRNHWYGKHPSEETRRQMSEVKRGERNNFYSKHHSDEARRKISEARKACERQRREI